MKPGTQNEMIFGRMVWVILAVGMVTTVGFAADSDIRLNSLGFLPDSPKKATIVAKAGEFTVKAAADGKVVISGTASGPVHQQDVGQDAWTADFSGVTVAGRYLIEVPGVGRSIEFEIGKSVYDFAFKTAMRAFYLWRCGTAVEGMHDGVRFAHGPCHLQDAYQDYTGFGTDRRDGVGGWHDAGDYGKYVVNAGATVGPMFLAWEHFEDRLAGVGLDIPDTASGFPDYLKEIKWETDWLLKMQYPDGSGKIVHKLTTLKFPGFILPEADTGKTYFTEWSTAATADFAAMMAMAGRIYRPYDAAYAKTCLDAAERSYACLKANPENKNPDLKAFSTGAYTTRDSDDRMWAAAELWETTGNAEYLRDFEQAAKAAGCRVEENWDWGNLGNLGLFTYVLSKRPGRDTGIVDEIFKNVLSTADAIVAKGKQDIYGRPLGGRYYWGCNGTVARQVVNLQVANRLSAKPEYVQTSLDAVGHLFGRNFYGRSFVTGLGVLPAMSPHDRRSGADAIRQPWPGYLTGGGQSATNWKDEQADYRTNEIAINWQGALVYALAAVQEIQDQK
jgi:endoglucanase